MSDRLKKQQKENQVKDRSARKEDDSNEVQSCFVANSNGNTINMLLH